MDEFNLIGAKITTIRFNKKITSEELAERCGFTLKMVEKMESGEVIPSLGHLIKVARALGIRLGTFLDDSAQLGPVVSRKDHHPAGTSFSTSNNEKNSSLHFFPLAGNKTVRHFEPFIIDIVPSESSLLPLSAHEGEEFIFVLAGQIEIIYGKERYRLSEGDSIYYDSVVDHHVHAANTEPAKILAVVYAPL